MGLTPTFTQSMSGYPRGGSPMLTLTTATYTPHSQLRGWQPLNPNTCRVGTMVGDEGTATCLTNTTMWRQSNLATGAFQSAYGKWVPLFPLMFCPKFHRTRLVTAEPRNLGQAERLALRKAPQQRRPAPLWVPRRPPTTWMSSVKARSLSTRRFSLVGTGQIVSHLAQCGLVSTATDMASTLSYHSGGMR